MVNGSSGLRLVGSGEREAATLNVDGPAVARPAPRPTHVRPPGSTPAPVGVVTDWERARDTVGPATGARLVATLDLCSLWSGDPPPDPSTTGLPSCPVGSSTPTPRGLGRTLPQSKKVSSTSCSFSFRLTLPESFAGVPEVTWTRGHPSTQLSHSRLYLLCLLVPTALEGSHGGRYRTGVRGWVDGDGEGRGRE